MNRNQKIENLKKEIHDCRVEIDNIVDGSHHMDLSNEQWMGIKEQNTKVDILQDIMWTLEEERNEEQGIFIFVR